MRWSTLDGRSSTWLWTELLSSLAVLLATGQLFGLLVIGAAAFSLVSTRFHPLQRWIISVRFRSLLGKSTEVTIDGDGLGFANSVASTFVPWSSITSVRSNDKTVAFIRDRVLMGYIPSSAFASIQEQAEIVEFATFRVGAAARPPGLN